MSEDQIDADPTRRFSNRVEYYVRYRPRYPAELLQFLKIEIGLAPTNVIADVGSGTGFLSELFLPNGNVVYGVEPNTEMREAAEERLQTLPAFRSVNGTAEATTLPAGSVDLVVAGQAFHWFDAAKTKIEFQRILRPGGHVALVWNERQSETSPLMRDYETLLDAVGIDYGRVRHQNIDDEALSRFFAPGPVHKMVFDNSQTVDFEGFKGRILSSSYTPLPGHPAYDSLMQALPELFDRYQEDGKVVFLYETRVYYGTL